VQAISAKFGVHVGSMKFNTQNEETISAHIIILNYKFIRVFSYTPCAIKVKVPDVVGKISTIIQFTK
jgi:hypothetical protein